MHHSPHLRQHRLHSLGVTEQESQQPEGSGTGITLKGKENKNGLSYVTPLHEQHGAHHSLDRHSHADVRIPVKPKT